MFKTDMMPVKCDARRHYVAGNICFKTRSDQANHDFKMMYEGRLQRYCLLLSKEKEVIKKLGFVKDKVRLRSHTFDNANLDTQEVKTRPTIQEAKPSFDESRRRNSTHCQPILRRPRSSITMPPTSSEIKNLRRLSEIGRSSTTCETKVQQYKRHSLPSRTESPPKDVKSKRRQEEMQKKAKLRIETMKSLETDCIKAKQLMKQFKSLSMTTLDRVGKDGGDCVNFREESSGKRRVNSWHI